MDGAQAWQWRWILKARCRILCASPHLTSSAMGDSFLLPNNQHQLLTDVLPQRWGCGEPSLPALLWWSYLSVSDDINQINSLPFFPNWKAFL